MLVYSLAIITDCFPLPLSLVKLILQDRESGCYDSTRRAVGIAKYYIIHLATSTTCFIRHLTERAFHKLCALQFSFMSKAMLLLMLCDSNLLSALALSVQSNADLMIFFHVYHSMTK